MQPRRVGEGLCKKERHAETAVDVPGLHLRHILIECFSEGVDSHLSENFPLWTALLSMRIEGLSRMRRIICFSAVWNDWLKRSPNSKDGERRAKIGKCKTINELPTSRYEFSLSKPFEKEYWTKHPVTETQKGSASATNVHMGEMLWKTRKVLQSENVLNTEDERFATSMDTGLPQLRNICQQLLQRYTQQQREL